MNKIELNLQGNLSELDTLISEIGEIEGVEDRRL